MDERSMPFSDPADGKEEIFRATYRTLYNHGYAALSIQRIADEAGVSKSTIYHHFENKEELLLEFAQQLPMELFVEEDEDVLTNLDRTLDLLIQGETPEGEAIDEYVSQGIHQVYLELRTQAAHDPRYREHFDATDARDRAHLASLIEEGIEEGVFRDVDPEAVAGMLYVCAKGAMFLASTTNDKEWLGKVREELDAHVQQIVRDDRSQG